MNMNLNAKKIIIVSNTAWYLYNFRLGLLYLISNKDYELHIVCPEDEYTAKLINLGFLVHKWGLNRSSINPLNEILSICKLMKIYMSIKPDIVHHFTIKACFYGSICSLLCRTKNVINCFTGLGHLFISTGKKIKLIRKLALPFSRFIFLNKNVKTIFQNNSDREYLLNLKLVKKRNSFVIPGSGVDINHFKPIKKKLNSKSLRLLFPSRIIKEKGIIELITAVDLLNKENIPIKLYIAGRTDQGNRSCITLKEERILKKQKNIIMVGHLDDIRTIYKDIDIVILPSWREGLSKSLLEAAAMGKAIITTNVPGCKEIVEHMKTGLLVRIKSPEELKESIIKLYKNPKLIVELGKAARKKVIREFELKKINNMTIDLYERY